MTCGLRTSQKQRKRGREFSQILPKREPPAPRRPPVWAGHRGGRGAGQVAADKGWRVASGETRPQDKGLQILPTTLVY